MSAGPTPIYRHSSMRHLSMSQSHVPDMMAAAKKRYTPPPSTSKSPFSSSNLSYGNQFKQNISSQTISDKVTVLIKYSLSLSLTLFLLYSDARTFTFSFLNFIL